MMTLLVALSITIFFVLPVLFLFSACMLSSRITHMEESSSYH